MNKTLIQNITISLEEERETIKRIQQGGKERETAIERLTQARLRLVAALAKQYANHNLSIDELIKAGCEGLVVAAEKFDERRGFKFICWAVWWVRVSIDMEIEKSNANKKLALKERVEFCFER